MFWMWERDINPIEVMVVLALIFLPNLRVKKLDAHKSGFALKVSLNSGTMNDSEKWNI